VAKDAHTGCSPATENWTRQEGSKAVQCSFAENHPVEANNAQLWSGFSYHPEVSIAQVVAQTWHADWHAFASQPALLP
jgi:hypothetical protein